MGQQLEAKILESFKRSFEKSSSKESFRRDIEKLLQAKVNQTMDQLKPGRFAVFSSLNSVTIYRVEKAAQIL